MKHFELCEFIKTQKFADVENRAFLVQIKNLLCIKGYIMATKNSFQVVVIFDYCILCGPKRKCSIAIIYFHSNYCILTWKFFFQVSIYSVAINISSWKLIFYVFLTYFSNLSFLEICLMKFNIGLFFIFAFYEYIFFHKMLWNILEYFEPAKWGSYEMPSLHFYVRLFVCFLFVSLSWIFLLETFVRTFWVFCKTLDCHLSEKLGQKCPKLTQN